MNGRVSIEADWSALFAQVCRFAVALMIGESQF
jgi:hypothetical protein